MTIPDNATLDMALYFYQQAQQEVDYQSTVLSAAREGFALATESYEEEDPGRFVIESRPWSYRVHIASSALADALLQLARAAALVNDLTEETPAEAEKN